MTQAVSSNTAASESLAAAVLPLRWQRSPGMRLAMLNHPDFRELRLTLTPKAGETVDMSVERLAETLKQNRAVVVQQLVFGPLAMHAGTLDAMRRIFGKMDWPVTWIEGDSCGAGPIAGMQITAVAGPPVQTLVHNNHIAGRMFDDGKARYCFIGDIGPQNASATAPEQARETLENLRLALGQAGMAMNDVARTWFFLDDILSWYGRFNEVRNAFFAGTHLQSSLFPASTGVSGKNPRGTALAAGVLAIRSQDSEVHIHAVPSPLQCPAPQYGSAFSRAVEIVSPCFRQLLVSGTASIAPDGRTAFVNDVRRQMGLTMDVVGKILRSRGMTLSDVTRATAYFKSAADHPLFDAWCVQNGHELLPVVSACCDICRDDLLFEIEVDAVVCRS